MLQNNQIAIFERIRNELKNLPGIVAHKDMVPFRVSAIEALKKSIDYRLSAVLILLYFKDEALFFILTERQNYKGNHAGQISLPGGKHEPSDQGTNFTALRETREEIGIPSESINLLGQLTEVYIPVSNFLVHPYIGFIDEAPIIIADKREVKSVIHCSLFDLLNDENRIVTDLVTPKGHKMKDIPAFKFNTKIVWGATAVILNEFKFILQRFV